MKIVTVVVTYNRYELLQECIDAILGQTRSTDLLVVIDNASTDNTQNLFARGAKYDVPSIAYKRMETNLGGAGGFYEGVRYAYFMGADWIWVMDDDTIPTPTALQGFCDALNIVSEEPGFMASAVFGPNGEPMNVPELDARREDNGYSSWYRYLNKGLVKIRSATFVSVLINKKAISKVGLPYKKLFIWGDDIEYTLRLSTYYGVAYMCGNSEVVHKRKITRIISIENANDPARIKQYHYLYRNGLLNAREYRGRKNVLRNICEYNILCIKILVNRYQTHKINKILAIHKGIWEYLLGTYGRKEFKNRFEIN